MKRMNYSLLRMITALVIGLLLVLFPDDAGNYFVIAIGAMFLLPSLIGTILYFAQKKRSYPSRFPIEGIGSMLFGLWLIIQPQFFTTLLTYILGFVLLMGGIQQIASLQAARRWVQVSIYYYVVPTLILIGGLVALFNPGGVQRTAFLIIGIGSLVYALQELVSWFSLLRHRPVTEELHAPNANQHLEPKDKEDEDDGIEDAEIIEIQRD